ncbi:MAG: methyltransferase [Erysipelotrichaceae bacterium]|nr:methyltransferase [Erysipelotrichaceae bacterium]
MAQYFENDGSVKDEEFPLTVTWHGKSYQLVSNHGVFSKDRLDTGTRVLLDNVAHYETAPERLLDMGCGIGVVGRICSDLWNCEITMIDINERACQLAGKNMENRRATILCQDGIQSGMFDCILFNPPIRTGKKVMYRLFDECMEHCDGRLWIVIRKQHGAQSALNYFEKKGYQVKRTGREKGFWVLRIEKNREHGS